MGNFVSPLTSLVVVDPEELEEIEKELDALLTTTAAPLTTPPPRTTVAPYTRDYGRGAGGFFGDPHFVIPLKGMNLCFNLHADDGDVYNLLHDSVTSHTINAKMSSNKNKHYTVVTEMSITDGDHLKISVHMNHFTLHQKDHWNPETYPYTSSLQLHINGVNITYYANNKKMIIKSKTFTYQIAFRFTSKIPHMDFFIEKFKSRGQLDGIIGQFIHKTAQVKPSKQIKGNRKAIHINGRTCPVSPQTRMKPTTKVQLKCWNALNDAEDLFQLPRSSYLREYLMQTEQKPFHKTPK